MLKESLRIIPRQFIGNQEIRPYGKFFADSTTPKDVLLIQAGLPGSFLTGAQEKLRKLKREQIEAVLLVPEGILPEQMLRLLPMGEDEETDPRAEERTPEQILLETSWYTGANPDFFYQYFSLGKYKKQLYAAYRSLYIGHQSGTRFHLVGHSYGAAALLYALSQCVKDGFPIPKSATFLAPFVKCAMDDKDPAVMLSIFNSAISGVVDRPQEEHEAELRKLLKQVAQVYRVAPGTSLVRQHREVFGRRFYETLGDLKKLKRCRGRETEVNVVLGGEDENIDGSHADLILQLTGKTRSQVKTLARDNHDLHHLNFGSLLKK